MALIIVSRTTRRRYCRSPRPVLVLFFRLDRRVIAIIVADRSRLLRSGLRPSRSVSTHRVSAIVPRGRGEAVARCPPVDSGLTAGEARGGIPTYTAARVARETAVTRSIKQVVD